MNTEISFEQAATSHLRRIGELIDERNDAQARVSRLQELWDCWQEAQGYSQQSKRYARFLAAYATCDKHGDFDWQPEQFGDVSDTEGQVSRWSP